MTEPRLVVIGTGRHGSRYIAELLTACGIPCSHEAYWNPFDTEDGALLGDSSWCAGGFLAGYEGAIFHQVRDPLAVVNSLVKSPDMGPSAELRRRVLGNPFGYDPLEQAIDTVIAWRKLCDAQPLAGRWRVEDVDEGVVRLVGSAVGIEPTNVAEALATIPKDTNHHGFAAWERTWDTLPRDGMTQALRRIAAREGYL